MRVLCLPTDGYGGHGGIAQHCRHLLGALAEDGRVEKIVAIPRVLPEASAPAPAGIEYLTGRSPSLAGYLSAVLGHGVLCRRWQVVVTEHIHLLPLAALIAWLHQARLCLVIHGFEAWTRPLKRPACLLEWALNRLDVVVAVSRVTRERFGRWSGLKDDRVKVIPNALPHVAGRTGPGVGALIERYAIGDGPVIMSMGRMSSTERAKGFDEVLGVLPALVESLPGIRYLLVGDGDDRHRLTRLAEELGIASRVIFTGRIGESEKADHFRLADAFVMPSRLEGFGYVFLEAMACGLPVVGSRLDGSNEPLMDGRLGTLVDPDDGDAIRRAILAAIAKGKSVPADLAHFSLAQFGARIRQAILGPPTGAEQQNPPGDGES